MNNELSSNYAELVVDNNAPFEEVNKQTGKRHQEWQSHFQNRNSYTDQVFLTMNLVDEVSEASTHFEIQEQYDKNLEEVDKSKTYTEWERKVININKLILRSEKIETINNALLKQKIQ